MNYVNRIISTFDGIKGRYGIFHGRIVCADGFSFLMATDWTCSRSKKNPSIFTTVLVDWPNGIDSRIDPYVQYNIDSSTFNEYSGESKPAPVDVINSIIKRHGGLIPAQSHPVHDYVGEFLLTFSLKNPVTGAISKRRRPGIVCADGIRISVQASSEHRCSPCASDVHKYDTVDVILPKITDDQILSDYFGKGAHEIPVTAVNWFIESRGGINRNVMRESLIIWNAGKRISEQNRRALEKAKIISA